MHYKQVLNPADADVWIFDLDNTLYSVHCDLGAQLGKRMGEFVSRFLDLPLEEARVIQKQYFLTHGTTLRGMMVEHGMQPKEYLDYVHDLDLSEIPIDKRLDLALQALPGRKVIYTNATNAHAERVLCRLGIKHHFEASFDIIDADYVPKPNQRPYELLLNRYSINPKTTVMVEDIAQNLVPAASLGMATVWVRGGRDIGLTYEQNSHVHHITDDLSAWITNLHS